MPPAVATARPTGTPASRALSDYLELTKPRVTLMVVVTTAIGFYLCSGAGLDLVLLFNTLIGTGLVLIIAGTLSMAFMGFAGLL